MKVLFLSDLHLGAKYIADPLNHEKRICEFLLEQGRDADHIYFLGDILDYWYEYKYVVPKGYIRFLGTLAHLTDNGVKITWLTGNHDIWLFGYLSKELGIEIIDSPVILREIGSKKFILSHGDRIGKSDMSFKLISSLFRNKICQKIFASIHPRWTVPFAHNWSSSSRCSHMVAEENDNILRDIVIEDSKDIINQYPDIRYIIMGHHHIMMDKKISGTNVDVIVLGDWIDKFSYAFFDGKELKLLRYLD